MEANTMNNVPVNEERVDALEIDLVKVILKHRADEQLSMRDTAATIINVLFTMATSQPNPKEAVDHLKEALDSVCKAWYAANKPDILGSLLVRTLVASGKLGESSKESTVEKQAEELRKAL